MRQRIKLWWRFAPAEVGSSLFILFLAIVVVGAFFLGRALWG